MHKTRINEILINNYVRSIAFKIYGYDLIVLIFFNLQLLKEKSKKGKEADCDLKL